MAGGVPAGLLVLDLDGTLLIGDDAALDHARQLAEFLDAREPGAGERLLGDVEAFLAGTAREGAPRAPDGYLAARSFALDAGLTDAEVTTAFLAHRARLAAGEVPFHAPEEAADVLARARQTVRVVLVTNAPSRGLAAILHSLGLGEAFDAVVADAGKPGGLPGAVAGLLPAEGAPDFGRVFSVGDIWENDLAPLAVRGATTGLIDRHGTRTGTPTHRAAAFGGLAPAILEWAAGREHRVNAV